MRATSILDGGSNRGPRKRKKKDLEQGGAPSGQLLQEILTTSLILPREWEDLPTPVQEELARIADTQQLLGDLVKLKLLTEYQRERIAAGRMSTLIVGNYRILAYLGAGGMGEVFKAHNLYLPRPVALKVLAPGAAQNPRRLQRFFVEMQAVAQLNHPNIVCALDAGQADSSSPTQDAIYYLAMEYVPGRSLEQKVREGPLAVGEACGLVYQVALGLAEAHKHRLIHRDIKPSNILVTPQGQAKLLDFGLARQFSSQLTRPGVLLGTIPFTAPEQLRDAKSVDVRADIYGLGGTLFFCLTGQIPFPEQENIFQEINQRLTSKPPSMSVHRPDIPAALDAMVTRMLDPDPDNRYPSAEHVYRALQPFLDTDACDLLSPPRGELIRPGGVRLSRETDAPAGRRILLADDEPDIRMLCRFTLEAEGWECTEAEDGAAALAIIATRPFDLVLLDVDMPQVNGRQVLECLRKNPPSPNLKIIMISGRESADEMSQMLQAGADDYITKPVSCVQLRSRAKAALRLRDAQARSDRLNRRLLAVNAELEQALSSRDSELIHARNAMVMALAKLVEHRTGESGAHPIRLQRYCRCLAEGAAALPAFEGQIDANFIQTLECCVPLHDMGNFALPDHILLKPGKLESDERLSMESHTMVGATTLQEVAQRHGAAVGFLHMAIDIARHHHERFDGSGYPDGLEGTAIPLAARIVALADVYDALRCRRSYRPALAHTAAYEVITGKEAPGFDPNLLEVFRRRAVAFDRIFRELPG